MTPNSDEHTLSTYYKKKRMLDTWEPKAVIHGLDIFRMLNKYKMILNTRNVIYHKKSRNTVVCLLKEE